MAKFKIGFTMSAETLFGIMSKFIPVDDLHVEEVIEHHAPIPDPTIRFDRRFDLPKPRKQKQYKRKPSKPVNLHAGINRILMEVLADGKPHRAVEFKPLLKQGGYSQNSVGSRLQSLEHHGIIKQTGDGTWRLVAQMPAKESV